jgi:hypothetical protein
MPHFKCAAGGSQAQGLAAEQAGDFGEISPNLRYGESDRCHSRRCRETSPRAALLFLAEESLARGSGAPDIADPLQNQAMWFAARNGMVGVKVAYRNCRSVIRASPEAFPETQARFSLLEREDSSP